MSSSKLFADEDDLDRLIKEKFTSPFRTGYTNIDGCFLPANHANYVDAIEHMEVYDDDVWLCGFPKSGKLLFIMMNLFFIFIGSNECAFFFYLNRNNVDNRDDLVYRKRS